MTPTIIGIVAAAALAWWKFRTVAHAAENATSTLIYCGAAIIIVWIIFGNHDKGAGSNA